MLLLDSTLTLSEWRAGKGCSLRTQAQPPSTENFIQELQLRQPASSILWNTYSFKNLPIGSTELECFGFSDEKITFKFISFYKHLAKITGYTIKPFCFISPFYSKKTGKPLHLHFHNAEIWTPQDIPKFKEVVLNQEWNFGKTSKQQNPVMERIDRCFRKHFPCDLYPQHPLTKPRGKNGNDSIIKSSGTSPQGGAIYYSNSGHHYVPELTREFYP